MKRSLVLIKHSTVATRATVPNQCKDVGHTEYNYELEVQASTRLDENDFLIDNTVLHRVIENVVQSKMGSCERLCLSVEEDILTALNDHGCFVEAIQFSIKPAGSNAWIKLVGEYDTVRVIKPEKKKHLMWSFHG